MSSWAKDMQDANTLFTKFVAEISSKFSGRLISTELEGGNLADIFDKYAGIDAIHVWKNKVRGVAVRIQWGKAWDTFTIRYKRVTGAPTEYEKRLSAIRGNDGALYPYLTIQAYATNRNDGDLLSYGVVRTVDLYDYLDSRIDDEGFFDEHTKPCPEGNTFLYVSFNELKEAGIPIVFSSFENQHMAKTLQETPALYHTNGTSP